MESTLLPRYPSQVSMFSFSGITCHPIFLSGHRLSAHRTVHRGAPVAGAPGELRVRPTRHRLGHPPGCSVSQDRAGRPRPRCARSSGRDAVCMRFCLSGFACSGKLCVTCHSRQIIVGNDLQGTTGSEVKSLSKSQRRRELAEKSMKRLARN